MSQAFLCPNCHASLEYEGGISPTIRCQYCNTTVIVPEELRTPLGGRVGMGGEAMPPDVAKLTEIARLIQQGKKIEAIKLMREISAMDLKSAKEAVERMERGESVQFSSVSSTSHPAFEVTPHPLQPQPTAVSSGNNLGCVLGFVILLILLGAGAGLFFMTSASSTVSDVVAPVLVTAVSNTEPGIPVNTATPIPTPTPAFADETFSFGGEEGVGPGYFSDTRNIGLDEDGNIYTGDYSNGRIQVFDSEGNYLTQWFISNPEAAMIAMDVDRQGRVYVIENGAINRYDGLSGELQTTLSAPGGTGYRDVVVAPGGGLVAYAFAPPDMLVWFDADGNIVQTVSEVLSGQTGDPESSAKIAVDGLGNVYLLGSAFTKVVFKFDAAGKFVTRIGSQGNEAGQFRSPRAIAVDNQGRIYVEDFDGIFVFDSDGRFLDTIPFRGVAFDMVFNDQNQLFLVDRNGNRVVQFTLQQRAN
ncbi:MAG: 6-bladed beta-propeller [Ardenticatenaceae bacterium]|nr:6-bladed beta-propeller [Ardenticatenaceae bacterium]